MPFKRSRLSLWYSIPFLTEAYAHKPIREAWNALSGRSTTKQEDLHYILANMLSLDCDPLMHLKAPEERLQSILFSLEQIPLSLFFNPGRRLNSKLFPYNRWVPLELNREVLECGSSLKFEKRVGSSSTSFLKLTLGSDITAVLIKTTAPQDNSQFDVQLEGKDDILRVQRDVHEQTYLDVREYQRACILYENVPSRRGDGHRGAMFYVSNQPTASGEDWMCLRFYCPVQTRRLPNSSILCSVHDTFPGTETTFNLQGEVLIEYSK